MAIMLRRVEIYVDVRGMLVFADVARRRMMN
jgi:hypothetical protein